MSFSKRAVARIAVDRTGEVRWTTADKDTGRQVGLRMSFPSERLAWAHCGPDEVPMRVTVASNAGPFSDHVTG